MSRKRKVVVLVILIAVIAVSVIAPFGVNWAVNAANYDPVNSLEDDYYAEKLSVSLFPTVTSSRFTAEKTKGLNFGKYEVGYVYNRNGYKSKNIEYQLNGMGVTSVRGKPNSQDLEFVYSQLKCEPETFEIPVDNVWEGVEDDIYYNAFFAIKDTQEDTLIGSTLYNKYVTNQGNKLVRWVGCTVEGSDRIWGLATPFRQTLIMPIDQSLFLLFNSLTTFPKTVKYLSRLGLFGDLESIDFAALRESARTTGKAVGLMMYGKGAELKSFQGNDDITLTRLNYSVRH